MNHMTDGWCASVGTTWPILHLHSKWTRPSSRTTLSDRSDGFLSANSPVPGIAGGLIRTDHSTVARREIFHKPRLSRAPREPPVAAVQHGNWFQKGKNWLTSFCRETLEMGVFQGVRAYAEALEWLSWLRSGTDQEGKKVSRRVRGGRNRHKRRAANTRHQRHIGYQ